jgi:hypothetical protein
MRRRADTQAYTHACTGAGSLWESAARDLATYAAEVIISRFVCQGGDLFAKG